MITCTMTQLNCVSNIYLFCYKNVANVAKWAENMSEQVEEDAEEEVDNFVEIYMKMMLDVEAVD